MKRSDNGERSEGLAINAIRHYEDRNSYKVEPWRYNLCVAYPDMAHKILSWTKGFDLVVEHDSAVMVVPDDVAYKFFVQFVLEKIGYADFKREVTANGYFSIIIGNRLAKPKERGSEEGKQSAADIIAKVKREVNAKKTYVKKGSKYDTVMRPDGYKILNEGE